MYFFEKPRSLSPKPEPYALNANGTLIYAIYTTIYLQIPNKNESTPGAPFFNNLLAF